MRRALHVAWFCAGAALTVTGCHWESRAPTPALTGALWDIAVSQTMSFSPDTFSCAPGQHLTIRVTNSLPLRGAEIAHTFVLLKPAVDAEAFGRETLTARPEDDYIPVRLLAQTLAHTRLVRPGDTTEIEITAPAHPGSYAVVCAFPGHCIVGMRGQLIVR